MTVEAPSMHDNEISHLRVPPHSIEAETSLLGALLLDNSAFDRVGDLLVESDFYRYEHQVIYSGISALMMASRPADVITVFEHLQRVGKEDEAGGLAYLNQLAQYIPSAGNVRRYAEIVRERSILRKLVSASDAIATMAFNTNGKEVESILDQSTALLSGLLAEGAPEDWESTGDGIIALLDRVEEQAQGEKPTFIPTGLRDLDEKLDGGMRDGELIIIAARPGMGKSALALTIGQNVALNEGLPVGMLSMEMSKAEVRNRQVSMVSHIHLSKIKRPERINDFDWSNLTRAVETLRNAQLYVSDQDSLNINQIRIKARSLKRRHGLRLLIVDYLGLMAGTDSKTPRAYQLEEATKGLKSLAKELKLPILLLAQVSREVEKRPDPMPILSDLRDTGAAEQDADIVIFIHRAIETKPDLNDEWKYYAKLSLAKYRNGGKGYIHMTYVGENVRFMDWKENEGPPQNMTRLKGGEL